jgi:hypothetical protein
MRQRWVTWLSAGLVLFTAAQAAAQDGIGQGSTEVRAGVDVRFVPDPIGGGDGTSSMNVRASVSRFLTDRISAGPLAGVSKLFFGETLGYAGGRIAYHFGSLDSTLVPFVDFSAAQNFGAAGSDPWDIQLLGGVKLFHPRSGGFMLIAPFYYRAFYDEESTGVEWFDSWGISWDVGIIF